MWTFIVESIYMEKYGVVLKMGKKFIQYLLMFVT